MALRPIIPVLIAAIAGLSGCTWKVHPQADLKDPTPVFVTEHGRHSRVAVPLNESTFVEYGFGEWAFYGLEDRSVISALRAAVGLGTPARSRRIVAANPEPDSFVAQSGGTRTIILEAERESVDQFVAEMEAHWKSVAPEARIRQADGVPVAPVSTPCYHLFQNSNHFTAQNLRALGFRVTGFPITSNFEVADDLSK